MATDVITLITRDHRKVEELFARLTSGKGDPSATVAELHALLIAHARAEEDRVYPSIDAHHGLEEHKEAEVLLDALVRPGRAPRSSARRWRNSSTRSTTTSRRRRASSCRSSPGSPAPSGWRSSARPSPSAATRNYAP
ncbi:hypothetical protein LDL08_24640 [Nonomuraea glycinis]|uniref:hemerythrin domain-containing protein n=1 Tax=Nonomuraea glycinis TaxID=2047744 RepID=UPI001CDA551D|nr:hemerythrin domain-containing protein [Nonomuraea glycinis]MCA2179381.1 hypothetical protein [Nonomuraea glycinis]